MCSAGGYGEQRLSAQQRRSSRDRSSPAATAFRVGVLLGQFPGSEEAVLAATAAAPAGGTGCQRRGGGCGSVGVRRRKIRVSLRVTSFSLVA